MENSRYIFRLIFLGFFFCYTSCIADNIIELRLGCTHMYPYEKSIKSCTELIKLEPSNSEAFSSRGESKYYLNDFISAILDFNQVILLSPKNIKAYFFRGNAKSMISDYHGAIQDYNILTTLNPNDTQIYLMRGSAKLSLDDNLGAIEDFNKSIALSNNYLAYLHRAQAKLNLKDYRGAILDLNIVIMRLESYLSKKKKIDPKLSKDLIANLEQLEKDLDEILTDDLARAYLLRGTSKIIISDKNSGCLDLSKAGEIGNINAYDLIPKYCN